MTSDACPECRVAKGDLGSGLLALREGAFVVHPKLEAPPVPGWMVVAPLRHVEQWDALDATELRELGPLVARVSAALRASTPTTRVYVSVFAEVLPHFHVHVVARPPEWPAEERGARLFLAEGRLGDPEPMALARRVYAHLAGSGAAKKAASPWTPALLSGLFWPGAGQLKNRRWVKGFFFSLMSGLVLARIAWRVASPAWDALLAAPAPLDFAEMWALAEEIRGRNAAELSALSLVLLALWAASVFDAWRDATTAARVRYR
jgi:diadenosine tetraphosphate (Ap4A) HIT family hydrolase